MLPKCRYPNALLKDQASLALQSGTSQAQAFGPSSSERWDFILFQAGGPVLVTRLDLPAAWLASSSMAAREL